MYLINCLNLRKSAAFWTIVYIIVISSLISPCFLWLSMKMKFTCTSPTPTKTQSAFLNHFWIEEKVKFFGKNVYCYFSSFKWLTINWKPGHLQKNKQKCDSVIRTRQNIRSLWKGILTIFQDPGKMLKMGKSIEKLPSSPLDPALAVLQAHIYVLSKLNIKRVFIC